MKCNRDVIVNPCKRKSQWRNGFKNVSSSKSTNEIPKAWF